LFIRFARKVGRAKKEKKTRRVGRFHAFWHSAKNWGECFNIRWKRKQKERARAKGKEETRKKVLVQANLEGVFFRPWKDRMYSSDTCYRPVSRLSPHREIFSHASEFVLSFFLPQRVYPFPIPFFSSWPLKNTLSASGTTFNRGSNCIARKSAPLRANRQSAHTFTSACIFFVVEK